MSSAPIALEPVDSLCVQVLMDNVTDPLLVDQGPAKRTGPFGTSGTLASTLLVEGHAPEMLVAEHGFSALVTVKRRGVEHQILFDTGVTPMGVVENMQRLELALSDIELIVLSHGHWDHVTGMDGVSAPDWRTGSPPRRTRSTLPLPEHVTSRDTGMTRLRLAR